MTVFTNLNIGQTYYVKETSFKDSNNNNLLTNQYSINFPNSNVDYFTITPTGISAYSSACTNILNITNEQKSYCYSIKKVDAENNNTPVSNTTWNLEGADGTTKSAATNSSGIATFTGLKYQDYTLKETTSNPADLDNNGTLDYWNDNGVLLIE